MRFGYFLLKIAGTDGKRIEDWDLVDFSEVSLDAEDLGGSTTTEAIAGLPRWGDERLASHTGYYELFNVCLASVGEDEEDGGTRFPDRVIAEEYRVMESGKRLNTSDVVDMREHIPVTSC
ncbi:hypothetical protein UO65_5912 [Actinokineospora spheciospongiae]|uniref:Uncharacterized protein n=1 Tax=Actinokineospora spheciospongiae TaxID=909613 RepID=W7ID62_9PSEU|nr:hypothetical protein [Actinokineospora spheciospongiae]EWC58795.1 hypothetical protein UO65_5912 [Actinokineospora spheciospongiae]